MVWRLRETAGLVAERRTAGPCASRPKEELICGENRQTWLEHRGGDGMALAIWAARCYGFLTLRETGEALGGLDYAAVGIAIKRLEHKAASETNLRKQMAMIGKKLNVETCPYLPAKFPVET